MLNCADNLGVNSDALHIDAMQHVVCSAHDIRSKVVQDGPRPERHEHFAAVRVRHDPAMKLLIDASNALSR